MFAQTRRLLALTLTILLASSCAAVAQQKHSGKAPVRRGRAMKASASKDARQQKPVKVLIPDLVTGQKNVEAAIDYNTFNVGLAPGAVVLVEFPALDSILRVHPGNQNLVTVDDTDTAPNYPLIFRPGDGFVVSKSGPQPFAIITVQMASGIPFVFKVYPVASIEDSATRVVIRYDRDKVVAARRAAGLPVNYKPVPLRPGVYAPEQPIPETVVKAANVDTNPREEISSVAALPDSTPEPTPLPSSRLTTSQSVPSPFPVSSVSPAISDRLPALSSPSNLRPVSNVVKAVSAPRPANGTDRILPASSKSVNNPRPLLANALGGSLRDYMKEVVSDSKAFSKFTKPLYGLSVAVSRPKDINLEARIIVIAVKNTLVESVRLVPGQPDLFIETLDDKRSPVLVEPIQKLGLETTAPLGDLLAPGATSYYAVAFTPPILGTHQYLRISVAQTTAADAPSSVDLTIKSR